MYISPTDRFPQINRNPPVITALRETILGADLEWDIHTETPTILGASDGDLHISVPFDQGINFLREHHKRNRKMIWVGHNFLQADLPLFHKYGVDIDPHQVEDTIVHHWLCNMNLCKGTKDEDQDGDKRGRGFMNMWTMSSIYTDFSNWKDCREGECNGPCPEHDPFWYNGMDSYIPLVALPEMMRQERLRGIDHLYPLHRDLMWVLGKWSRDGILTATEYVSKLQGDFVADKNLLYDKGRMKRKEAQTEEALPFNPDSSPQVKDFFKSRNILLENTQEETVREAVAEHPENVELRKLLDYKELGDGVDRWFAPRVWNSSKSKWNGFVDADGYVHPHFGPFTSSGRLQCAGPNMQNVAKRRIDRKTKESVGKRVRRAVIAPEGHLLYRADFKNAENLTYLWMAGYRDIPEEDFHTWMAGVMGLQPTDEFVMRIGGGSTREASKTIVHATDYLEGIKLATPAQLNNPRIMREISFGARVVFPDWKVFGKIVTFTGINLAERAFGAATMENRKRALDGQMIYFRRFDKILGFYKMICAQVEKDAAVIPPHGYYHACVTPETKVLTSDLQWKNIGELQVGSEVVGFDEYPNRRKNRRLIPTEISALKFDQEEVFRVVTDKGDLLATAQHLWLARRTLGIHPGKNAWVRKDGRWCGLMWLPTSALRKGQQIAFLCSPWKTDESYDAGWLAGFFDGEGHLNKDYVAATQNEGLVLQNALRILKEKGFSFRHNEREDRDAKHIHIFGSEGLRLLGSIRPKRLLKNSGKIWNGRCFSGRFAEKATVLSVESIGRKDIVRFGTKEQTIITEGFLTHNSYGYEEDRLKQAASIWGSQPVAHFMKIACIRADAHPRLLPRLTVHDELVYYVDCCYDPKEVKKWIEECMVFETPEMPGFKMRVDVSYSPVDKTREVPQSNWADLKEIA